MLLIMCCIYSTVSTAQIITQIAGGNKPDGGYSEGTNNEALSANVNVPSDIKINTAGELYFVDRENYCIRKIDVNGKISVVAGIATEGGNDYNEGGDPTEYEPTAGQVATTQKMGFITDLVLTGENTFAFIVKNSIYTVNSDKIIENKFPLTSSGALIARGEYIYTYNVNNLTEIKISDGSRRQIPLTVPSNIKSMVLDSNDDIIALCQGGQILRINQSYSISILATGFTQSNTYARRIAVDKYDNIYIAGNKLYKLDHNAYIKSEVVNLNSQLHGVTVDKQDNIYITDSDGNKIVKVSFGPATPANFTATAGITKIDLSWNAVAGATGYKIYRGTSVTGLTELTTVSATTYTDVNVESGTTYYYSVSTLNAQEQESARATTANASPIIPPTAPVFTSTPVNQVNENQLYLYKPEGSDLNGDNIVFTSNALPSWLKLGSVNTPTLFSGSSSLTWGNDVAADAAGNIYVSQSDGIYRETANHSLSQIYNSGSQSGVTANRVYGMTISGNYLYASITISPARGSEYQKLIKINLNNPANVSTILTLEGGQSACYSLSIYQNKLYACLQQQGKVIQIDLSNNISNDYITNLAGPWAIDFDSNGALYILSYNKLQKYVNGNLSDLLMLSGVPSPASLRLDSSNNIYMSTLNPDRYNVVMYSPDLSSSVKIFDSSISGVNYRISDDGNYIASSKGVYKVESAFALSGTPASGTSGSYPIILTASDGTLSSTQNFTINVKGSQAITFASTGSAVYGDADFIPAATSTNSTLPITFTSSDPTVATIESGKVHILKTGTTTITASQAGNAIYQDAIPVNHILTITKAALTVKADDKSKIMGTANPALTASYSGLVNGDTESILSNQVTLSATASQNSALGPYTITVSGPASTANYTVTYVNGNLQVMPGAPSSISLAAAAGMIYENQPAGTPAGTLSSTSEDPNAVFTYSLPAGDQDNSLFSISGNQLKTAASFNYEQKSSYNINVRSTTQHGFSLDKIFTINIADVNEVPTINTIADQSVCSSAGSQTIALSDITAGPESGQTAGIYVNTNRPDLFSKLSISKSAGSNGVLSYEPLSGASGEAIMTVTVKDNGGTSNGGTDTYTTSFTIKVNALPEGSVSSDLGLSIIKGQTAKLTASGGTSYSWASANGIVSGQNSATLSVRPDKATTYVVTITNASGCSVSQQITITPKSEISVVVVTNILTPNGDGANDNFMISNVDMYRNGLLKIYDKTGREVYAQPNYDNTWNGQVNGKTLATGSYLYVISFAGTGLPALRGYINIVYN